MKCRVGTRKVLPLMRWEIFLRELIQEKGFCRAENHFCPYLLSIVLDDLLDCERIAFIQNTRYPRSHNSCLLTSDLFNGVAKEGLVVQANLGNHSNRLVLHDICRIQLSSQTNLNYSHFNFLSGKNLESGCSKQ